MPAARPKQPKQGCAQRLLPRQMLIDLDAQEHAKANGHGELNPHARKFQDGRERFFGLIG